MPQAGREQDRGTGSFLRHVIRSCLSLETHQWTQHSQCFVPAVDKTADGHISLVQGLWGCWCSPKKRGPLRGTHGELYLPISRTPSSPAASNWGQAQRRPHTEHPILQHTQVMALQLCTEARIGFAGAWPSRQPFQSGHTIFFQDDEQLEVKISQPPYNSFQSSHATQPASSLSTSFHPFILVPRAGILYRYFLLFWAHSQPFGALLCFSSYFSAWETLYWWDLTPPWRCSGSQTSDLHLQFEV